MSTSRYIPNTGFEEATSFSPRGSQDLQMHLRVLEERWRRFYPEIPWSQLDYLPSVPVQATGSEAQLSGGAGSTSVDDLYNEAVPLQTTGSYQQPHGTSAMQDSAPERRKHKPAVFINAYVRREETENELTPFGENANRSLTVTLLTSLCDDRGITVNPGDEFVYGGQTWEVRSTRIPERGRWKTTNIPLFIECRCTVKQIGS